MGKKKKLRAMKALANKMVAINEFHTEHHWMKGSEILAWDTIKEIDGQPIDPEKMYDYRAPVMMIHNNQRRMKRAFLRNGSDGVIALLQSNMKVMSENA